MGIFSKKKDKGLKELVGVCDCGADFNPGEEGSCMECEKMICPLCSRGLECKPCYTSRIDREDRIRAQRRKEKLEKERERERKHQQINKEEWSIIGAHGWQIGMAKVHEKRRDKK